MKNNKGKNVLAYLLTRGPLTVLDCIHYCHTTELRKYVSRFRMNGIPIKDETVSMSNENGKSIFKKYYIDPLYIEGLHEEEGLLDEKVDNLWKSISYTGVEI